MQDVVLVSSDVLYRLSFINCNKWILQERNLSVPLVLWQCIGKLINKTQAIAQALRVNEFMGNYV